MQPPSFESLISAPWADDDEHPNLSEAYHHLDPQQRQKFKNSAQEDADDNLDCVAILGYN